MRPLNAFISHVHADNDITDRYAVALKLHGIDVWYDRLDMPDGGALSARIEQELKNRFTFIVLITEESAESYWVQLETNAFRALAAKDPSRLILPVKIRPCEMPTLLEGTLWIDATAISFDESVDRIVRAVYQEDPVKAAEQQPEFSPAIRSVTREPVPDIVAAFPVTVAVITFLVLLAIVLVIYTVAIGDGTSSHVITISGLSIGTALTIFIGCALLGWLYGMLHFVVSRLLRWISAAMSRVPPTEYACSMDIRIAATAKGEIVRRLTERGIALQRDTQPAHLPLRTVALVYAREERLARNESLDRCGVRAVMRIQRSGLSLKGVITRAAHAFFTIIKLQRSSLPFKGVVMHAVYTLIEYEIKVVQAGQEPIYTMDYARVTLQSREELDDKTVASAQTMIKQYLLNPYLQQPLRLD